MKLKFRKEKEMNLNRVEKIYKELDNARFLPRSAYINLIAPSFNRSILEISKKN